jgi:hypothetical protein
MSFENKSLSNRFGSYANIGGAGKVMVQKESQRIKAMVSNQSAYSAPVARTQAGADI